MRDHGSGRPWQSKGVLHASGVIRRAGISSCLLTLSLPPAIPTPARYAVGAQENPSRLSPVNRLNAMTCMRREQPSAFRHVVSRTLASFAWSISVFPLVNPISVPSSIPLSFNLFGHMGVDGPHEPLQLLVRSGSASGYGPRSPSSPSRSSDSPPDRPGRSVGPPRSGTRSATWHSRSNRARRTTRRRVRSARCR